jgi:crotonobetainyl-CoA:carnitine CoA-transferase CaiB-like acyl-CoA transferase
MSLEQPLAPYRVLEIATGAGAFCGRVLADLGAEVTKLEPHPGDVMRTQAPLAGGTGISFLWYNAGKAGLTVDLDAPAGQERVRRALANYDVLVDGCEPGWLASHGLDPSALRRDFPHLVITSVSHFGQSGPYRDWKGSALVDFALAGCLVRSGLPDQPPCAPPYQLPYAMGGVAAAFATVAALWERGRTGEGDWLDCSVLEAVQAQADWSVPGYSATGNQAKRAGAGPVFRTYRAADGWVRVINLSIKQWEAVKRWLGNPPELAGPEWNNPLYRAANPEVPDRFFNEKCNGRTMSDLFHDAQRAGVGLVPIYAPAEAVEDAHFRERGTFVSFPLPGASSVPAPGTFVRMAGRRPSPPRPAPGLEADAPLATVPVAVTRSGGDGLPLAGIRVIEVGSGAVGPEIARMLAVLGADTVKVESASQVDFMRLQGPDIESSAPWSSSSRNKRSLRLNLRHEEGRRLASALAACADVIVENNTAGVMDRLGIGYADVAEANPGIVYVSSQAFGATGPAAGYGGFGPTNQAVSGTTFLWNHPDPARPEGVQAIHPDHLLGRMGAMAAIAALDERRRSGRGQHIDLGQAEFAMACIGEAFIESGLLGQSAPPRGNLNPSGAPHGVFPCQGDDQWISITVEADDQWQRLAALVGEEGWDDPALATVAGRLARRDLLEAQLAAWTALQPAIQLMRRLQAAGIPAGAAYTTVQVMADVHLNERGYFQAVTHPVLGTLRMEGEPYRAENLRRAEPRPAPLFGQHTREVLRDWLALDDAAVDRLQEAGALA